MQSFFEKSHGEKKVTWAEKKQIMQNATKLINEQIELSIKENYEESCAQLRQQGRDDKEIAQFFQEVRRDMQIKFFKMFKKQHKQALHDILAQKAESASAH